MLKKRFLFVVLAPVAVLFTAGEARAGLAACNDIDVRAHAQCELVTSGGCTAQCEPTHFEAACSAKLAAQCDGQCNASATAECTGTCEADCNAKCAADPGALDCEGSCTGTCNADCDARCAGEAAGGAASGSCKAKCQANCAGKCTAECTGTPPSVSCDAKCKASCQGSCRAKANAKCQIDCQTNGYAQCTANLEGGCKAQCEQPRGALFCDGQYVDTGNNLQQCIDALKAQLDITVTGEASGSCSGNTCTGEAEGSASCAASRSTAPVTPLFAVVATIGLAIARSRRTKRENF